MIFVTLRRSCKHAPVFTWSTPGLEGKPVSQARTVARPQVQFEPGDGGGTHSLTAQYVSWVAVKFMFEHSPRALLTRAQHGVRNVNKIGLLWPSRTAAHVV